MSDTEQYDCTNDVLLHKERVKWWIQEIAVHRLQYRAEHHDDSKLSDPVEKALFDHWTPELRKFTFGSDEYKIALDGMGEGVKRHYASNRHHPEHFPNGINDMTLADVVEMVCDWAAAAEAKGGPVDLTHAAARFGLSEQLVKIIANTLWEQDCWNEIGGAQKPSMCPLDRRGGPIEGIHK